MPEQETGKRWKVALAALVALFVCAQIASMMMAARTVKVLEPDYYRQGVRYGEQSKPAEKAAGWRILCSVKGETFSVQVLDAGGAPVSGAEASFAPGRTPEKNAKPFPLTEGEPGIYRAALVADGTQETRGTIRIRHGETLISEKVALFR